MKNPPGFVLITLCSLVTALAWCSLVTARNVEAAPQSGAGSRTVTVLGIITDERDARIVDALVQFSRGDVKVSTKTDREGFYEIRLERGLYDIEVTAHGFQRIYTKEFDVGRVPTTEINFHMAVASSGPGAIVTALPEPLPPRISAELSEQSASSAAHAAQYTTIKVVQAWIPMKDGVRLAVNLYMPDGPLSDVKPVEKFPAILEYLPYRKDDWTLARDWDLHSYFVRRGYVTARVDIRGTGASEGVPPDREYSEQEQQDGLAVIDWLSKQAWSNGSVGMMGISWGGFNAIQLARLHPPALKAIIALCATEELFHDDIHYIDGLMHLDEFELAMDLQLGLTRAPDFPTDEKSLAVRFDATPWFLLYLKHQRDGEFWRRASVAPNHYADYTVPSFMIGGFLDGYRDSIPRFFEYSKAPIKALLGPWNHAFPHAAEPGPSIEWRAEATRWWDYWLKGEQNGIMDEPRFEVYMRHWYPPDPKIAEIPGDWRAETTWPPANMRTQTLFLEPNHTLGDAPPPALTLSGDNLQYLPSIGEEAGFWWGDFTADQRPIDAYSLVYDSLPLAQDTAALGWPKAILQVSASAPLADWFVRLSDVAPDGTETMITGAGQSGAQRDSAANPVNLEPNRKYVIPIELHVTSWRFPAGHRIRVAISNALWPMIWPTPYSMTTSLWYGGPNASRLDLPLVPLDPPVRPHFAAPEEEAPLAGVASEGDTWPPQDWTVTRDVLAGSTRVVWSGNDSSTYPWGKLKDHEQMSYVVADAKPAASTARGEASTTVELSGRVLVWSVVLDLRSDEKNFYYRFERHLTENGKPLRDKTWEEVVSRDHQ